MSPSTGEETMTPAGTEFGNDGAELVAFATREGGGTMMGGGGCLSVLFDDL